MYFIFVDDSKQAKPKRRGMGSLYALGGLAVAHDRLASLEKDVETLCRSVGFPGRTDEFKWSPRRGTWMYKSLTGSDREAFFISVVEVLAAADVVVAIVMVD